MTKRTNFISTLSEVRSPHSVRQLLAAKYSAFTLDSLHSVIIIGAATEGQRLVEQCHAQSIRVLAVCDGNPSKHGQIFSGFKVTPISEVMQWKGDIPCVIASHKPLNAIKELLKMGVQNVAPYALLQILYPSIFIPHMFYEGWIEDLVQNKDQWLHLAENLSDDLSLKTLNAITGFRLDLDIHHLKSVIDYNSYFSEDVVQSNLGSILIDGGAFDGDTVSNYIEAVNNDFHRIIAFEPDPLTFAKLKQRFCGDPRVEPINAGLHQHKGVMKFSNDASRASLFSEQGDIDVIVTSIDEFLNGSPVNYIKLNIEGAELGTLAGATNSIKNYRPLLAIAAYHAPDHIWRIAKLIHEIEPSYKLYLRQQDGGAVETVIYAVP